MSKIILIRGMAGVGKTFLSNRLAARLKIPVIRKDDIFDTVFPYISDNQLRNQYSYELINKIIDTNLACGTDLIIDCPYHFKNQLVQMKEWIEGRSGKFLPILCICSDEQIWEDRFNERKANPKANQIITNYKEMMAHYTRQGIRTEPLDNELVLDTIQELDQLLNKVVRYSQ